ncbi:MAG: DUF4209 domain-containing protein [Flavobacteriales bacterium]|nr:DUF4209 domain-containing protein [Flavobacteriales bacterium]
MDKIPENILLFYSSLDNLQSFNIWNINKEIQTIENIDQEWKSKILTERKVLNHNLNKGRLEANFQSTNVIGKQNNQSLFTKKEIEYLKERLLIVNNIWLISRYNHILWQETKNNQYAEIAIEKYINCLTKIKSEESRELMIIVAAIIYISKKTKKKILEVKEIILAIMDSYPNWVKFSLINEILETNYLLNNELKPIAKKTIDWIEKENSASYFTNQSNLNICISLFQRLKLPTESIYELLAKNEDLIIKEHPNDDDFVKYTSIGNKAHFLKLAKKNEDYEKTMKEFSRLKQTIKLHKISIELDDNKTEMFNYYLNMRSDAILKLSTSQILAYFASDESILVDPKENVERAKESIRQSLHNLFTTSVFDINTNFKKLKDSEKLDFEIIKSYTIAHNIQIQSLFFKVFVNGIISGKINYYNIYNFLEKETWYGTRFTRSATSNEIDEKSSWITMLAPGIHNLISQFELIVIMNTNKISNFILCIDSLTLKFEGALRDFIRLSGGNTTIEKRGDLQEQLLEELLENDVTKNYFSEKDIELFKYTFTKKGKNIRNNVAHSFMEFSDYSLQTASLIFFCLLRLGKYTFEEKTDSE